MAAPGQQSMGSPLGIHIEDTMFLNVNGTQDMFVPDHLETSKLCQMLMCPACCLFVPFVSKNNKIEYYKQCGLCSCPYAVTLNGQKVGKVHDVGCCDNGCLMCCCPCLKCSGKIKIMGMDGADGEEKFTFARSLFCCWPLVVALGYACAPLGMSCIALNGCCNYCSGTEFRKITQPVYKGPWSPKTGGEPEKMGDFVMTERFQPVSCCCAVPIPMKYYYVPTSEYGKNLAQQDLANLSLVLHLYKGLPVPCKQCSPAGFAVPTGVWCLDCGLDTTVSWNSVQDILRESDAKV